MATIYEKLTAVCNAIRTKTGKTELLTLDQMASDLNAIPENNSSSLSVSGATVTVPAGNYKTDGTKSVATATQATPSITVSSDGLITASATQTAGYVSAGTKDATKQLPVQAAQTITPGTANKTISSGKYLTGTQTIQGDSKLISSNIAKGISIFGVTGSYSGSELNFSFVSGTTQPSNPTENTIWFKTSTNVTSVKLLSQITDSGSTGNIIITFEAIDAFDTTDKTFMLLDNQISGYNTQIIIQLLKCYQYLNNNWQLIDSYIYKNNAWIAYSEVILYLFNNGETYINTTGGWTGSGSVGTTLSVVSGASGPVWLSYQYLKTINAIDMSSYSTIHILVSNYYDKGTIGISTTDDISTYDTSVSVGSAKEYTIDVSSLTGNYYVKIQSIGRQNNTNYYQSIGFKVSRIWIE